MAKPIALALWDGVGQTWNRMHKLDPSHDVSIVGFVVDVRMIPTTLTL